MKGSFLFSKSFGALRRQFPRASAFLCARMGSGGYLGRHLTFGVAMVVAGCWFFGELAGNTADDGSLAASVQRIDIHSDSDSAPGAGAARWEVNLLCSGTMVGLVTLLAAALLARWRSWTCLAFLLMTAGTGSLFNVPLQSFLARWHRVMPTPSIQNLSGDNFPSGEAMAATLLYGALAGVGVLTFRDWSYRAIAGFVAALLIFRVCLGRVYLGLDSLRDVEGAIAISLAWLAFCLTAVATFRRRRLILDQARLATL